MTTQSIFEILFVEKEFNRRGVILSTELGYNVYLGYNRKTCTLTIRESLPESKVRRREILSPESAYTVIDKIFQQYYPDSHKAQQLVKTDEFQMKLAKYLSVPKSFSKPVS